MEFLDLEGMYAFYSQTTPKGAENSKSVSQCVSMSGDAEDGVCATPTPSSSSSDDSPQSRTVPIFIHKELSRVQRKSQPAPLTAALPSISSLATENVMKEMERLAASQLKGMERKQYLMQVMRSKLPPSSSETYTNCPRSIPLKIALGMIKKSKQRACATQKNEILSNPLTHKSNKKRGKKAFEYVLTTDNHPLKKSLQQQRQKPAPAKDRGITEGVGRLKDGTLHIPKSLIKKIQS